MIVDLLLYLGKVQIILPIFLGFIYFNRRNVDIPLNLFGICIFTIIYNDFLKGLFEIPLKLPLSGFALPSGHMHFSVVFYTFIAIYSRRNRIAPLILLIFIFLHGYALVNKGYHEIVDLLAAVGFGVISLLIFARLRLSIFGLAALMIVIKNPELIYFSIVMLVVVCLDILIAKKVNEGFKLAVIFLRKNRYNF